jgi:hypothetical protein
MKDVTDKPHEYTYWSLADSHSHISLHTILKTRPSIWASDVQRELVLVKGAVMPCFRSYGLENSFTAQQSLCSYSSSKRSHIENFSLTSFLFNLRVLLFLSLVQSEYLKCLNSIQNEVYIFRQRHNQYDVVVWVYFMPGHSSYRPGLFLSWKWKNTDDNVVPKFILGEGGYK